MHIIYSFLQCHLLIISNIITFPLYFDCEIKDAIVPRMYIFLIITLLFQSTYKKITDRPFTFLQTLTQRLPHQMFYDVEI